MIIEKVKINHHNRVKILCSYCDTFNHENETYADLDKQFCYICYKCAMNMMLVDGTCGYWLMRLDIIVGSHMLNLNTPLITWRDISTKKTEFVCFFFNIELRPPMSTNVTGLIHL
jgi:hypothetical protein